MFAVAAQPDRVEKSPTPAEAASIVSFWTIFAFLSVLCVLVLVLLMGIRRKQRKLLSTKKKPRTRHVDAWTIAGERMKSPDDLDDLIDTPPPDPNGNFEPDSRPPGGSRGNWGGGPNTGGGGSSGGPRE